MARPRSGTPEGDLATARWRETMNERYGGVTERMAEIGRKGGLVQVPKGFALSGKAVEAGRLGGKNRTGWRKHKTTES